MGIRVSDSGGQPQYVSFLVDAAGRDSAFGRWLPGRKAHRLGGMVGFTTVLRTTVEHTHTTIEAAAQGWWYSSPLPGRRLRVALLTDGDLVDRHSSTTAEWWWQRLQATLHVGRSITVDPAMTPRGIDARSQLTTNETDLPWLAVGDALASHDPLRGRGVLDALDGARAATDAIGRYLEDDDRRGLAEYTATARRGFHRYAAERRAYYGAERRFSAAPFWRRRAAAVRSAAITVAEELRDDFRGPATQ